MASEAFAYNKQELRALSNTFKAMDEQATQEAKEVTGGLADFLKGKIEASSNSRGPAAQRIAQGGSVSKSSVSGQITYGFAGQKFSGGGTTKQLWPGTEFGSNKFKQFPSFSGKGPNGGSRGWFIYPTLRANQPAIVKAWDEAFNKITEKWN